MCVDSCINIQWVGGGAGQLIFFNPWWMVRGQNIWPPVGGVRPKIPSTLKTDDWKQICESCCDYVWLILSRKISLISNSSGHRSYYHRLYYRDFKKIALIILCIESFFACLLPFCWYYFHFSFQGVKFETVVVVVRQWVVLYPGLRAALSFSLDFKVFACFSFLPTELWVCWCFCGACVCAVDGIEWCTFWHTMHLAIVIPKCMTQR